MREGLHRRPPVVGPQAVGPRLHLRDQVLGQQLRSRKARASASARSLALPEKPWPCPSITTSSADGNVLTALSEYAIGTMRSLSPCMISTGPRYDPSMS